MLAYFLAVAVGPAAEPASADPAVPTRTYLHPLADGCDSRATADEVVVCGARNPDEQYRLRPIENRGYGDKPIRIETKLGNGTLGLGTDQRSVGGFPSNRIMLTFKLPF